MPVSVEWTGGYPTLCFGEWVIHVGGIRLTGLGSDPFDTYGTYSEWSFDEDWSEQFSDYEAGRIFETWKESPPNNLLESLKRHGIEASEELLLVLYDEISSCDWRHGECGGCI